MHSWRRTIPAPLGAEGVHALGRRRRVWRLLLATLKSSVWRDVDYQEPKEPQTFPPNGILPFLPLGASPLLLYDCAPQARAVQVLQHKQQNWKVTMLPVKYGHKALHSVGGRAMRCARTGWRFLSASTLY